MLGTPLLQDGKAVGALVVLRRTVRPFTAHQIALLKTFAEQAAIALENARLSRELEDRNRDLTEALEQQTATGEILRVISSSPTEIQPVLDAVAEQRRPVLRRLRRVHLPAGRRRTCALAAHHGPIHGPASVSIPVVRGSIGRERRSSGGPFTSPISRRSRRSFPRAALLPGSGGHRATLSVPLLREGEVAGVIQLRRLEVDPVHGQADRPAPDLRRPGRDRHRERAAVQGAGGAQSRPDRGARAADGDERDPARDQPARRRTCSRSSTRSSQSAVRLCDGALQRTLPVRRRADPPGRPAQLHRRTALGGPPRVPEPAAAGVTARPARSSSGAVVHIPDVELRSRLSPPRACRGAVGLPKRALRPDAARGRSHRRHHGVPGATPGSFSDSADRAAEDLRRPGGHRHRERAPVHGAGGAQPRSHRGAGAADGDRARSSRSSAARRPISSRSSTSSPRARSGCAGPRWAW